MRRSALLTALVFLGIGGGAEKQYRPSPTGCKPCLDGVRGGNRAREVGDRRPRIPHARRRPPIPSNHIR